MAVVFTAVSMGFLTSRCSALARADQIQSRPLWAWTNFAIEPEGPIEVGDGLVELLPGPPDVAPVAEGQAPWGRAGCGLGVIVDGLVVLAPVFQMVRLLRSQACRGSTRIASL